MELRNPSAREIKRILEDPLGSTPPNTRWTLQGFGMLRLYLTDDEVWRLHIWDAGMAVTDVTTVHDHPWDLDSRIISGHLHNQRFERLDEGVETQGHDAEWNAVLIRTGEGGGPKQDPEKWWLRPSPTESYDPGDLYHQDAPEIHESIPQPGCVTVVRRTFSRQRDIATSLYRSTPEWVSAEPRPAYPEEIMHFTMLALERWNG